MKIQLRPTGFKLFSPAQIVTLALVATIVLVNSGLLSGALVIAWALAIAVVWSYVSYFLERRAWNNGRSVYGAHWKLDGYWVFFQVYREKIHAAPRRGDVIVLSHFEPQPGVCAFCAQAENL